LNTSNICKQNTVKAAKQTAKRICQPKPKGNRMLKQFGYNGE